MAENKRNSISGILLLFLMVVFFSFLQKEKARDTIITSSVISNMISAGLQAIIVPTIPTPGKDLQWVDKPGTKITNPDCISNREVIFNHLISGYFNSYQLKFLFTNPLIGLIFPQKIPEQGKEDDFLRFI